MYVLPRKIIVEAWTYFQVEHKSWCCISYKNDVGLMSWRIVSNSKSVRHFIRSPLLDHTSNGMNLKRARYLCTDFSDINRVWAIIYVAQTTYKVKPYRSPVQILRICSWHLFKYLNFALFCTPAHGHALCILVWAITYCLYKFMGVPAWDANTHLLRAQAAGQASCNPLYHGRVQLCGSIWIVHSQLYYNYNIDYLYDYAYSIS